MAEATVKDIFVPEDMKDFVSSYQRLAGLSETGKMDEPTKQSLIQTLKQQGINLNGALNTPNSAAVKALKTALEARMDALREEHETTLRKNQASTVIGDLKRNGLNEDQTNAVIAEMSKPSGTSHDFGALLPQGQTKFQQNGRTVSRDDFIIFLNDITSSGQSAAQRWREQGGYVGDNLSSGDKTNIAAFNLFNGLQTGTYTDHTTALAGAKYTLEADRVYQDVDMIQQLERAKKEYALGTGAMRQAAKNTLKDGGEELLKKFHEACPDLAEKDLSLAIVTGQFVPAFEDLELLKYSFNDPTLKDIVADDTLLNDLAISVRDNKETFKFLHDALGEKPSIDAIKAKLTEIAANPDHPLAQNVAKTLDSMSNFEWSPLIETWQAVKMGEHFGTLLDIKDPIQTLRHTGVDENGLVTSTEIQANGAQIMVDKLYGQLKPERFANLYGMDYDQAITAAAHGKDALPAALQADLERIALYSTIDQHYATGKTWSNVREDAPNPHADYMALRQRYLSGVPIAQPAPEPVADDTLDEDCLENYIVKDGEVVTDIKIVSSVENVKAIQNTLNKLRTALSTLPDDKPLDVDGMMGDNTSRALEELVIRAQTALSTRFNEASHDYSLDTLDKVGTFLKGKGFTDEEVSTFKQAVNAMQEEGSWKISYRTGLLREGDCIPVDTNTPASNDEVYDPEQDGTPSTTLLNLKH